MYKKFFGFKERPFQLVPNPAYLYLSKCHEEALAHLSYAIAQGDGFVEIIGEVGTGKTTLCRVFLESLATGIEAAYIFNPKLDSIQLLKAVNDDFGIDSSPDTSKELIDILNRFLMAKKAQGKKIILIIDEAQNLSAEVLEQLRLLSNLETTTSKLIQIILVGQPELGKTLDSYELRQLGQRITLSCRLLPLSLGETMEYISHRLYVASGTRPVKFSHAAVRQIHRYSKGVPRLINIVCDRALLTAYVMNSREITRAIVKKTLRELSVNRKPVTRRFFAPGFALGVFVLFFLSFLLIRASSDPVGAKHPIPGASAESAETDSPSSDNSEPDRFPMPSGKNRMVGEGDSVAGAFDEGLFLGPPGTRGEAVQEHTRKAALQTVLRLWDDSLSVSGKLDTLSDDATYFNLGARMNGYSLYQVNDDFSLVQNLNLPAIAEFYMPGYEDPIYLVMKGMKGEKMVLDQGNGKTLVMSRIEIDQQWTGVAYVLWKNFLGCVGTIPGSAPEESILSLKMLLRDLGYDTVDINAVYDKETEKIVKLIQKKYGFKADGKVNDLTKIVIYNEKKAFPIPYVIPDKTLEEVPDQSAKG